MQLPQPPLPMAEGESISKINDLALCIMTLALRNKSYDAIYAA